MLSNICSYHITAKPSRPLLVSATEPPTVWTGTTVNDYTVVTMVAHGWVAIMAGAAQTISMPLLSKFSNQLKPLICLMTVKTQPFMLDTANNIERSHFIEETVRY